MSDETIQEQELEPVGETGRSHVTFLNGGEDVEVRFKDGRRVLSRIVVSRLGGPDKVQQQAKTFASYTYDDFMTAFNRTQERRMLNSIHARFVSNALRVTRRF